MSFLRRARVAAILLVSGVAFAQQPLALSETIARSLSHGQEVTVITLRASQAIGTGDAAEGVVDATLSLRGTLSRDESPSSSTLTGSDLNERDRQFLAALQKPFGTGTVVGIELQGARSRSNALFQTLDPAHTAAVLFTVEQPLLRGFWGGRPAMVVAIAERETEAALFQYRAQLTDVIAVAIRRYFEQYRASANVDAGRRSLALAEQLLRESEVRVREGVQPELARLQAAAERSRRAEELLRAEEELRVAARELQRVVGGDIGSGVAFTLTDTPRGETAPLSEVSVEREQARTFRPELLAARSQQMAASLRSERAENALLPELNLRGAVGRESLTGSGESEEYRGSFSDAFEALSDNDYPRYEGGLVFRMPLGNFAARGDAMVARAIAREREARVQQVEEQVELELANARDGVTTAAKRVIAGRDSLTFAKAALVSAERRYQVGVASVREVVEVQRDVADAERTLSSALVDQELANVALYRARGELLERYGVVALSEEELRRRVE